VFIGVPLILHILVRDIIVDETKPKSKTVRRSAWAITTGLFLIAIPVDRQPHAF
jgi:hypothetical protein